MLFLKELDSTGETNILEDYITTLYQLERGCEYDKMTKELICDQLVVGIIDESLSEWL